MADILVLDLGTTYFKASVFNYSGELRALESCPIPSLRSPDDRHEIEADAFRSAIVQLVLNLESRLTNGLRDVEAVTFSTQTNSFLLLDPKGKPLTPIIVWDDRRAQQLADEIRDTLAMPSLYETTGVPAFSTDFMAAKLLWLQRRMPDVIAQTARVGLISDYLAHWLTGQWVTEAGAAGLTGLVDIHALEWWSDALDRIGLAVEWMPDVVRAGTDLGPIRADIARTLHLPEQCRFVVGCLDQYAGAIGAGNVLPDGVSETTGTVLATVRCSDGCTAANGTDVFCGPGYAPGVYYEMVFGSVAANLLECYRNALGEDVSFADLDRAAMQAEPRHGATPLSNESDASDLMERIEARARDCGQGEMTRAILERVAFALYDQVNTLCNDAQPNEIVCAGGAARSRLWRTIKANVLGIPTAALECPEPTSLGAAMLAMASITGETIPGLADRLVKRGEVVQPDIAEYNAYAAMRAANSR